MIRLIATDVDGTLVKDGTMTINPEADRAGDHLCGVFRAAV